MLVLDDEDLVAWAAGLDELFGRVAGRFHCAEPGRRARAYVRGLFVPLAGRNGWMLAEAAGDGTPDGMQRLLNAAAWDAGGIRDDVRAYAVEHLTCQLGVFLACTTGKGRTLIDRELYPPRSWTEDPARCREAAVPEDVVFVTKTTQARAMLARALDAGVPATAAYRSPPPRVTWRFHHDGVFVVKPSARVVDVGVPPST